MPANMIKVGDNVFETEDIQLPMRFIGRKIDIGGDLRTARILQQGWLITKHVGGVPQSQRTEWRDVPLVTEE